MYKNSLEFTRTRTAGGTNYVVPTLTRTKHFIGRHGRDGYYSRGEILDYKIEKNFTSLNNENIQTAVDAWIANPTTAEAIYGHISSWDVSQVTDMINLFYGTTFNEDISGWDVSNVSAMNGMFRNTTSFNQPLNNWNVSSATSLAATFKDAINFNQPLNNWNVSNVTNMVKTFEGATNFNQSLNNWDVSNVTNMERMFENATSFNNGQVISFRGSDIEYVSPDYYSSSNLGKIVRNSTSNENYSLNDQMFYSNITYPNDSVLKYEY